MSDEGYKGWLSNGLVEHLERWRVYTVQRQKGHTLNGNSSNRKHYMLGVITGIISIVAGSGGLASYQNCNMCDEDEAARCESFVILRIISSSIALIAAILTFLQMFLSYEADSEQHKRAADSFGDLEKEIDDTLSLPIDLRDEPVTFLRSVRSRYRELVKHSPNLPEKYHEELKYKIRDGRMSPLPPKRETVSVPNLNIDDEKVKNILERDDCLDFDPDKMECTDSKKAAIVAAQVTSSRNIDRQRALLRNLDHELSRMDNHTTQDIHSDQYFESLQYSEPKQYGRNRQRTIPTITQSSKSASFSDIEKYKNSDSDKPLSESELEEPIIESNNPNDHTHPQDTSTHDPSHSE